MGVTASYGHTSRVQQPTAPVLAVVVDRFDVIIVLLAVAWAGCGYAVYRLRASEWYATRMHPYIPLRAREPFPLLARTIHAVVGVAGFVGMLSMLVLRTR